MTRISEQDLILPALYVIQKQPAITTSELINELRNIFNPVGEDAKILNNRKDDKFSQIVRNLVSHHTLDRTYRYTILSKSKGKASRHKLSKKGLTYLETNLLYLESLFSNKFEYSETIKSLEVVNQSQVDGQKILLFDENIFVSEGRKKTVTVQVYERSKLLRKKAIDFYTQNGKIVCQACGFDFYSVYGSLGRGYIEIHHQKPVYQYEETDFLQLIAEAMEDLIPLCSNCHRMVHRKRGKLVSLKKLKEILDDSG